MTEGDYCLEDEIARKSGEAYAWAENEFRRGALSKNSYYTALVAIDTALLGLAPQPFTDWSCGERKRIGRSTENEDVVLFSESRVVKLTLLRAESFVSMSVIKRDSNEDPVTRDFFDYESQNQAKWAYDKFQELKNQLLDKGFKVL